MSGKAKSNRDLYQETIPEMAINIEKEVKADTGGTQGIVPESMIQLIQQMSCYETNEQKAAILFVWYNTRMTELRKAIQRRTRAIATKARNLPYELYAINLAKAHQKTDKGINKLRDRAKLCGEPGYNPDDYLTHPIQKKIGII